MGGSPSHVLAPEWDYKARRSDNIAKVSCVLIRWGFGTWIAFGLRNARVSVFLEAIARFQLSVKLSFLIAGTALVVAAPLIYKLKAKIIEQNQRIQSLEQRIESLLPSQTQLYRPRRGD